MNCQQCHRSAVPDESDIWPWNASQIQTYHLFKLQFYLHLQNWRDASFDQNLQIIILISHATSVSDKLSKKPLHSLKNQGYVGPLQSFKDPWSPHRLQAGNMPGNFSVSDSANMFSINTLKVLFG